MWHALILCFSLTAAGIHAATNKTFPEDFKFGVATAAYQIEGGWNADGKGENIWDHLCHSAGNPVANGDTGDVACDSYHQYQEDVALLKALGVQRYRFSISWSRILPTGFANRINQAGVDYYLNLLKELKAANIEALVTLYHWDLPQPLQDIGGWPNPLVADYFADYARICFEKFGDYVALWATFNEPEATCRLGYGAGVHPPRIGASGVGDYLCSKTVLRAHAKAYHIYQDEFKAQQNGKVSIVLDTSWFEPGTNSTEDVEAAETCRQFMFGWFGNAIFKRNYPQVMIDRIAFRSQSEGYPESRLPLLTQEEIEYISGTADFIGVNTYGTTLCYAQDEPSFDGSPSWDKDNGQRMEGGPSNDGMRKLLNWLSDSYDRREIIVTENGAADGDGTLDDTARIDYLREYLSNALLARIEDGVNITGYTIWSLIDNMEWLSGYTMKFGLYNVDFQSANRTRTPKKSAEYIKNVIATRCLVDECE